MSERSANRDPGDLVKELAIVTAEAVTAAKIDHKTGVHDAIGKRERLIAELMGFNPDEPLPPFHSELAKERRASLENIDKSLINKIRRLEKQFYTHMNANVKRIHDEESKLLKGHTAIKGFRNSFEPKSRGKRIDMTG